MGSILGNGGGKLTEDEKSRAIVFRASGLSYREIQERIPRVSFQGLWNQLTKPELKAEIARLQKEFQARNLNRAMEKWTEVVHGDYEEKVVRDKDGEVVVSKTGEPVVIRDDTGRKIQARFIERTMESGGILPSSTGTSIFINQLNAQVNMFDNPMVKQLMERHNGVLEGYDPKREMDDVIDVTDAEVK